MKNIARALFPSLSFLVLLAFPPLTQSATLKVSDVRGFQAPERMRIVVDTNTVPRYRLFTLDKPNRVVLDIENAYTRNKSLKIKLPVSIVTKVRTGKKGSKGLRIVFELDRKVQPNTFTLKPTGNYGHRLVIDLKHGKRISTKKAAQEKIALNKTRTGKPVWTVAIDAGHGGDDPGAIGRRYRTREKTVVLAIARELRKLVRQDRDMRALMVRDGDYYVGLEDRPRIAEENYADVFISIHADAIPGRRAKGASVYALSRKGASDSLTRYLENSENSSDILGGVAKTRIKDPTLKKVLFDLELTGNMGFSIELGKYILKELRRAGPLHRRSVGQAGFMVLRSAKTPSVLVETGFISNPVEEKKLRSRIHQRKIARSIYNGIRKYLKAKNFKPYALQVQQRGATNPGSKRQHVVRKGESLHSIARKYDVNVDILRFANNLQGNRVRVGKRLQIP